MSIDTRNLQAGDHLVSSRLGYTHHGIYIGNNKVIHYAGFCDGFKVGKIEINNLHNFTQHKKTRVKFHPNRKYSCEEALKRAYSRLGEDSYHLVLNNCEHFVNWCIYGQHRSDQVTNAINLITSMVIHKAIVHSFNSKRLF